MSPYFSGLAGGVFSSFSHLGMVVSPAFCHEEFRDYKERCENNTATLAPLCLTSHLSRTVAKFTI
jgi:hypothetical protein